jgi:hypothetical protein
MSRHNSQRMIGGENYDIAVDKVDDQLRQL